MEWSPSPVVAASCARLYRIQSLAGMVASHLPAKGLRGWLRLKEKASEQFPPVRGFSLPRPPARIVNQSLDSYCVEKKEAPESTNSENEEAPHGGSGASWVPWGGTCDGEGLARHSVNLVTQGDETISRA